MSDELINRATEYLANGGLFNPELMDHEKVRDLIYQMRNEIAALKKELEIARGARQWIKCEDRMPEYNEKILTSGIHGRATGTLSGQGWVIDGYLRAGSENPNHWMPLPEVPKG